MKYLLLIFFVFFLSNCSDRSKKVEILQGDWKIVYDGFYPLRDHGYIHFSGDSIFFDSYSYQKYTIKDDSLLIELDSPYESIYTGLVTKDRYKILYQSNDSLALQGVKIYSDGYKIVNDTTQILLNRFVPLESQPKLTRIEYASGSCFGNCPQKDIIIDSSGFYYYGPRKYDDVDQPYRSNSEKEMFEHIAFLTSTIPISKFDSLNGVGIDAQVLIADFYFENGIKKHVITDRMSPISPIIARLDFSKGFAKSVIPSDTIMISVRDSISNHNYY